MTKVHYGMSRTTHAVFISLADASRRAGYPGKVRTIGYAESFSASRQQLVLEFEGALLPVDIRLVEPFSFRHGQLLLVIGELCSGEYGQTILRAMVYRALDGLDVTAYLAAMGARLGSGEGIT